jgi:hypothetical protein
MTPPCSQGEADATSERQLLDATDLSGASSVAIHLGQRERDP